MLIPPSTLEDLARSLAQSAGAPFSFAHAEVPLNPLDLVRSGGDRLVDATYFATPGGEEIAGLGVAWKAAASGPDRFSSLKDAADGIQLPVGYRLMLGFSFIDDGPEDPAWAGFPGGELLLPEITAVRSEGRCRLLVALPADRDKKPLLDQLRVLSPPGLAHLPEPGDHTVESQPQPSAWREGVAEAVAAIEAGSLEKVVLARSVTVRSELAFDPFDIAEYLRDAYPQCYPFVWRNGGAAFFGASPELLLRKRGAAVVSNPLAGSAPRGEGDVEDELLGEALLASKKDRVEHELVVEDIASRLVPFVADLQVPSEPTLRRMAAVQHLSTEIRGRMKLDRSPLAILDALHPTPAVGGTPREEALAFIDKAEGLDRGWYSGGIGWIENGGDAEIALSLRCALARDGLARLYAGAGVVAGSDPDEELVETRLKLRPLLELIAAS